jgi:hypothetical protein
MNLNTSRPLLLPVGCRAEPRKETIRADGKYVFKFITHLSRGGETITDGVYVLVMRQDREKWVKIRKNATRESVERAIRARKKTFKHKKAVAK